MRFLEVLWALLGEDINPEGVQKKKKKNRGLPSVEETVSRVGEQIPHKVSYTAGTLGHRWELRLGVMGGQSRLSIEL